MVPLFGSKSNECSWRGWLVLVAIKNWHCIASQPEYQLYPSIIIEINFIIVWNWIFFSVEEAGELAGWLAKPAFINVNERKYGEWCFEWKVLETNNLCCWGVSESMNEYQRKLSKMHFINHHRWLKLIWDIN